MKVEKVWGDYIVYNVYGHYAIYENDEFVTSCDNWSEVRKVIYT